MLDNRCSIYPELITISFIDGFFVALITVSDIQRRRHLGMLGFSWLSTINKLRELTLLGALRCRKCMQVWFCLLVSGQCKEVTELNEFQSHKVPLLKLIFYFASNLSYIIKHLAMLECSNVSRLGKILCYVWVFVSSKLIILRIDCIQLINVPRAQNNNCPIANGELKGIRESGDCRVSHPTELVTF